MNTPVSKTQQEVAEEIIKAYCSRYELNREDILHRNKYGKIQVRHNNVRVDEMRKSLAYYLYIYSRMTMEQIKVLLGWKDHSSVVRCVQQGNQHLSCNDEVFKSYYDVLVSVVNRWYVENVQPKKPIEL